MLIRTLCLLLVVYIFQSFLAPSQTTNNVGNQMLTEDQALSTLRSRSTNPRDAGFIITRRFEPTPITRHVAQQSWDEAQSKHLELYGKGILIDLMRTGGFAVLEFDTKTDRAMKLHLITLGEDGGTSLQSQTLEGELSRGDTLALLRRGQNFAEALNSSSSQIEQMLQTFGGTHVPAFERSGGHGYFAVPHHVARLATQPDEVLELSRLSGALGLWPIRYAPSMVAYAANPKAAIELAASEQSSLEKEFITARGKSPDFINDLLDLDSIATHDQLAQRLQWRRDLNSFLERRRPIPPDSATFKANTSISVIPLQLGVTKEDSENLYAVMSAQGLISIWTHAGKGNFILRAVSDGFD
jgi:hypothetical protein